MAWTWIYPGETVGLVGESGCGKTTFGRVLTRLYEPTAGQVLFQGGIFTANTLLMHDCRYRGEKEGSIAGWQHAGLLSPHPDDLQNPYSSLNPRKTVRQIVSVPLQNRGHQGLSASIEEEMATCCRRVGIPERRMDTYPHQFSGGQRQRIGIARALAMRPKFIVCDEPVSALDVSIQAQVINLLDELQEEFDLTYLFIAHDLSVVHYISDRVAIMYLGKIVEEGPTDEVFANPRTPIPRRCGRRARWWTRPLAGSASSWKGPCPVPSIRPAAAAFTPAALPRSARSASKRSPTSPPWAKATAQPAISLLGHDLWS